MDSALRSRIHSPGCVWTWTYDCEEAFESLQREDREAAHMLRAMARRAHRHGLPATSNNNDPNARQATHRCPVGDRVAELDICAFKEPDNPMPWTGELYAESSDGSKLYRLYFIEGRPDWMAMTEEIIGSGVGWKPAGAHPTWTSEDQTREIHAAMVSGVERCQNLRRKWRRWNSA